MAFGLQKIPWLSKEEKWICESTARIVDIWTGDFLSRNSRMSPFFSFFWLTISSLMGFTLLGSAIHFSDRVDLSAYCINHCVLSFDAAIAISMMWINKESIHYVLDVALCTFSYDSDLVDEFSKKVIRERVKILKIVRNLLFCSGFGVIFMVQVFFVLEAFCFGSYQTMFPIYLGLDLNGWAVYLLVVAWQDCYYVIASAMVAASLAISVIVWNHLSTEITILKFAVSHIHDIVKEQTKKTPTATTKDKFSEIELYIIYCNLIAKHHASILRYFREFGKGMSFFTPVLFYSGFLIMVSAGLSTMSDNIGIKLKLSAVVVGQFAGMYVWCWIGQNLLDKGEEIMQALAGASWWLMPKCCADTFRLIMVGCKIPLALNTPTGQVANHECYMDMLKGAYQMVNVVYQVTQ